MSAAPILRAGKFTTSKARPPIRTDFTRRRRAAGLGRSFSAPTTGAKPGTNRERTKRPRRARPKPRATSSSMTVRETGKPLTTHQWYDGTQHPWEFKRVWHLEPSLTDPDTVYAGVEDAALFRSTDGGAKLAGTLRPARPRHRPQVAAGRRRHVPAHDYSRPEQSPADVHCHLGGGRVPHRRRRQDMEADQPWAAFPIHPRPECRGRPLRSPHRDEPVASGRALHAEALGRDAQRRRRRFNG
jgi:hypothetical protein